MHTRKFLRKSYAINKHYRAGCAYGVYLVTKLMQAFILTDTGANIIFNGETYSMADVEFFYDANTNELVLYEEQDVSTIFAGQWRENGEKVLQLFCE